MTEVIRLEGRRRIDGGSRDRTSPPDDINLRLATRPLTDLGNAERFFARYGETFIWCQELGHAAWDGRRYSFDDAENKVLTAVHMTVRGIQDEARALKESEFDVLIREKTRTKSELWLSDQIAAWGRVSENAGRINAIAAQARAMMSVRPDDLDADPMRMTVQNGTLHFRRPKDAAGGDLVILLPHNPKDRITKLAPVTYDPNALAPNFHRFLSEIQPEAGQRRMLAQWFGYNGTGLVDEQKLLFFYGKGRNGKSTLVDSVAVILGDYSDTVPIETFLDQGVKKKGADASPDLAALKGVRNLRTSEPEKRSKLAEALIKLVTGGEPFKTRFLNKDFFLLRPAFKLTISGNYRPDISGTDEGIWRRVVLVPFLVQIAKEAVDPELPDKLKAEASGILNWMLDGLRDWLENRLMIPESVAEATKSYRDDSDPLGRFIEFCTMGEAGARVQSSKLHQLFVAWCKSHGETEWTNKGFSAAMKERGFRTKQSDVMWWLDLRATKEVADFLDGSGHVKGSDESPPPDDRPFADPEAYD